MSLPTTSSLWQPPKLGFGKLSYFSTCLWVFAKPQVMVTNSHAIANSEKIAFACFCLVPPCRHIYLAHCLHNHKYAVIQWMKKRQTSSKTVLWFSICHKTQRTKKLSPQCHYSRLFYPVRMVRRLSLYCVDLLKVCLIVPSFAYWLYEWSRSRADF